MTPVLIAFLAVSVSAASAQDPVQWTGTLAHRAGDGTVVLTLRAAMDNGWYIYSMRQPEDGPTPLRFRAPAGSGVVLGTVTGPQPRVSYDRGFRARVGKYYSNSAFTVNVRLERPMTSVPLQIRYQACNDNICLPPRTKTVQVNLTPALR